MLILFCIRINFAFAQRFQAELFAGVAGTQLSGDNLSGFNRAGGFAGAGIRTSLNKAFSIGFRGGLFQKGSQSRARTDGPDSAYYRLRINYIEFPLSLRYTLRPALYVELGPSLGVYLNSREEDANGVLPEPRAFYRYDLSVAGTLGYVLGKKTDLQFGYWQSVAPIRPHQSGAVFRLNRGQYSSSITFSLLYTFSAGEKTGKPVE
ncbi:MAG: outer membrane beta-barrel protein [Bacteroidota bacterium]